jgi:hypothetical protein
MRKIKNIKLLKIARIVRKSKEDMKSLHLVVSSYKSLNFIEFEMIKKYNLKLGKKEFLKLVAYYCAINDVSFSNYLAKTSIRHKVIFDFLVKNLEKYNVKSIQKLKIRKFAESYNLHVYAIHSFIIYYFLNLKRIEKLKRDYNSKK